MTIMNLGFTGLGVRDPMYPQYNPNITPVYYSSFHFISIIPEWSVGTRGIVFSTLLLLLAGPNNAQAPRMLPTYPRYSCTPLLRNPIESTHDPKLSPDPYTELASSNNRLLQIPEPLKATHQPRHPTNSATNIL